MLSQMWKSAEALALLWQPRSAGMRVIKRYPNRKLYDTETKHYVALDEIAGYIRQGLDIYVVDYASGEDLTTVTLTQIIFEQEKKGGGFLPQAVLTGLIQAGGTTLGALRRTLASSVEFLHQVDEEIERRLQVLINCGELPEEEGRRLRDKLVARSCQDFAQAVPDEDDVMRVMERRGIATRADVQQLVDALGVVAGKLDELSGTATPDAATDTSASEQPPAA